jgi:hypothetical protein
MLWPDSKNFRPIKTKGLLYANPKIIKSVCSELVNEISLYAKASCLVYKDYEGIMTKEYLSANRSLWHKPMLNDKFIGSHTYTSGTTGRQFNYLIDSRYYEYLEYYYHYQAVIREFFDYKPKNIFYFMANPIPIMGRRNDEYVQKFVNYPKIYSHGLRNVTVHSVSSNNLTSEYLEKAVDYISNNDIDIMLSDGAHVNALCNFIKNNGKNFKICKLLSNTNEKVMVEDLEFLKENQYIDDWCDHMKCWDGGAAFMTCKHYTYHLLDDVAYCHSVDGKLIATDYFNYVSPFINYWNGDYCDIEDQYEKCKCGRWYRPFKFVKTRDFGSTEIKSLEVKNKIGELKIPNIKFVKIGSRNEITIISSENVSETNKDLIKKALPQATFYFVDNNA